ncbi:reverse transcriptase domain-containing protein [Tanacetum coccineum]
MKNGIVIRDYEQTHKEKIDYEKANMQKLKFLLERIQASRTELNYDQNLTIPRQQRQKLDAVVRTEEPDTRGHQIRKVGTFGERNQKRESLVNRYSAWRMGNISRKDRASHEREIGANLNDRELGMIPSTMHSAILYQSEEGPRVIMSEYQDIRRCEQARRLKKSLSQVPPEVSECVNLEEKIIVNPKYPETLKIGSEIFVTEHKLNENKKITPVQQKKRGMTPERSATASKEVEELKKGFLEKKDFTWTKEADKAFEEMKKYIEKLPTLVAPKAGKDFLEETQKEDDEIDLQSIEEKGKHTRWKLYTNEASSSDGSGAGLMIVSPEGMEFIYALKFEFMETNNEAEYEVVIAGLLIAKEMKIEEIIVFVDSQLIANQVNGSYEAKHHHMKQYL